jgi:hypothetical protein
VRLVLERSLADPKDGSSIRPLLEVTKTVILRLAKEQHRKLKERQLQIKNGARIKTLIDVRLKKEYLNCYSEWEAFAESLERFADWADVLLDK